MLASNVGCFIKLFSIPLLADWEIVFATLQSLRRAQLLAFTLLFLASPEAECAAWLLLEGTGCSKGRCEFFHISSLPTIH